MLPISTYPMWYNVIPPFVPLDPSLYLAYPTITKSLDFSIFRNYIGYVLRNVYLIHEQHVVPPTYSVSNQFLINAPLGSLMDSTTNPKVKTVEG